jgi:hypothetical protein
VVTGSTVARRPRVGLHLPTHPMTGFPVLAQSAAPVGPFPGRPISLSRTGVEEGIAAFSAPLHAAPAPLMGTRLPQSAAVGDRREEPSGSGVCAAGVSVPCISNWQGVTLSRV